jgi:hypothetical protein
MRVLQLLHGTLHNVPFYDLVHSDGPHAALLRSNS